MRDSVRHHAFAARLVQHPGSPFRDDDFEPSPRAVQRGGQSCGPAPDDEQIDHVRPASASFSTLMRVFSRTAFSTVNTAAVIHAECTSGSAIPSATTAT